MLRFCDNLLLSGEPHVAALFTSAQIAYINLISVKPNVKVDVAYYRKLWWPTDECVACCQQHYVWYTWFQQDNVPSHRHYMHEFIATDLLERQLVSDPSHGSVQSRFAETRFAETLTLTLTLTPNPNFGESGRHPPHHLRSTAAVVLL